MQRTTVKNTVFNSRSWKAGLLTLAFMVLGANNAFAQSCPAFMVGDFETPQALYSLGEDIGIVLTLGTEFIEPLPDDTSTQYVDIRKFLYHMDCTPGSTINSCTWAGNEVVFDPEGDSVWTDCVDTTGTDADVPPPTLQWGDDGLTVTFTVDDDTDDAIRIDSPAQDELASCQLGFDVRVTNLAPGNQEREILEILGWFGTTPGDPPVANVECSNNVPNAIVEQRLTIGIQNNNTSFLVIKDFTDNNPAPVDIHFACNGGFLSQEQFSITDPATGGTFPWVRFIVYGMEDEGVNCDIYEDPVPTGYTVSYTAGASAEAEYESISTPDHPDACSYEAVKGGEFTCDVTNTLNPARVVVNKVWEGDALDNRLPLIADVHWRCFNMGNSSSGGSVPMDGYYTFVGETDSFDITGIYPSYKGDSFCRVDELITNSSVESDKSECDRVEVPLGAVPDPSCTIYNTVFFEGIPTLNQYGMALMALLMLGVGLLGLRRFA